MYVIQRNDGWFVTRPGRRGSYSQNLQDARTFSTREAAHREVFPENERILTLEEAVLHQQQQLKRPITKATI